MTTQKPGLRESALFDRDVIHDIQHAAETGIYDIREVLAMPKIPSSSRFRSPSLA